MIYRTAFRDSTNLQRVEAAAKPTPVKSRAALPLDKTATRTRENGHDCTLVDTAILAEKVVARLFHSLTRFALDYSFNCETSRETTHINGDHSSCGGCQAAHAALSCKLYDKIHQIAKASLQEKSFDQLPPAYQGYLNTCFKLTSDDLASLRSENTDERMDVFELHAELMDPRKKKMLFSGTSLEWERAGTYENPTSSNRFDCFLERHLRPIEDDLARRCSEGEITPVDALVELQDAYCNLVEKAIPNLKADLNSLKDLQEAWDKMIELQKEVTSQNFETYLEAVDQYLALYKSRFSKKTKAESIGIPSLDSLKSHLRDTQSYNILKNLQKNRNFLFYKTSKHFLKTSQNASEEFSKAEKDIERRLIEAANQIDQLHHTRDQIEDMYKYSFGKQDNDGNLTLPTKEEVAEAFLTRI